MRVIYKYPLDIVPVQHLTLPVGANILCVQEQYQKAWIWAIVDPEAVTTTRTVNIIGTGHAAYNIDGDNYVGTVQLAQQALIWHIFIEPEGDMTDG
jgi:hypothetical protein